jgi:hypothetical protein
LEVVLHFLNLLELLLADLDPGEGVLYLEGLTAKPPFSSRDRSPALLDFLETSLRKFLIQSTRFLLLEMWISVEGWGGAALIGVIKGRCMPILVIWGKEVGACY